MSSERAGIYQRINGGEFTVSVELNPVGDNPATRLVRFVHQLQEEGQSIVDINDRPSSSSLDIAGKLLTAEPKIVVFPHIATGNYLKAEFIKGITGAVNIDGLDNFLIVGGDQTTKARDQIFRPSVAISAIHSLRADLEIPIFLAAAFNQNARNPEREEKALKAKGEAGADFFLSQVVFTPAQLDQTADFFHKQADKPLIIGIWPITSLEITRRIFSGAISGIVLPEDEYSQYFDSKLNQDKLKEIGLKNAKELIEYARCSGKVQGVYIVAPPNPRDIAKIIK